MSDVLLGTCCTVSEGILCHATCNWVGVGVLLEGSTVLGSRTERVTQAETQTLAGMDEFNNACVPL